MWHAFLQQPLKQQALRTISIYSRLLYDVCELQNSLNEMLQSTTQFVPSFLYDVDASWFCVWWFGYQNLRVCLAIVLISWFLVNVIVWEKFIYSYETRFMSNCPYRFLISYDSTFCVTWYLKCTWNYVKFNIGVLYVTCQLAWNSCGKKSIHQNHLITQNVKYNMYL
jgi:hypothetical protein